MNRLLLDTRGDIPFPEAQMTIHQPTLKEIGLIGEESFLLGCQFLDFSKEKFSEEDKKHLIDKTNFEVLMSVISDKKNKAIQQGKASAMMVLLLMFPEYEINIIPSGFLFRKQKGEETESHFIDKNNYEVFKVILSDMFCLKELRGTATGKTYNPGGPMAKQLAEKFRKRHEKLAQMKSGGQAGSEGLNLFSRYISILAVGEHKSKNELAQYSVYQLFDEFKRFQKEQEYRTWLKLKTTFGAKDVKDVDNWMEDLYTPSTSNELMV